MNEASDGITLFLLRELPRLIVVEDVTPEEFRKFILVNQ
jgi:hypothetical protein